MYILSLSDYGNMKAGELKKLSYYLICTGLLNIRITKNYRLLISGSCTVLYGQALKSKRRTCVHERQDFIGDFFVLLIREERTEPNSR